MRVAWKSPVVMLIVSVMVGFGVGTGGVWAQSSASQNDWPCIQRFVPNLSLAVYWPVPPTEDQLGGWRDQPETAQFARQLGELDGVDDQDREAIEAFANAIPEAEREARLSALADGIVAVANERRKTYLDGIRRYTQQQAVMARQIEARLNELAQPATDDDAVARGQAEDTLRWQQRIFDQRERSIIALCESPIAIEETLSEVLRTVAQYLP